MWRDDYEDRDKQKSDRSNSVWMTDVNATFWQPKKMARISGLFQTDRQVYFCIMVRSYIIACRPFWNGRDITNGKEHDEKEVQMIWY